MSVPEEVPAAVELAWREHAPRLRRSLLGLTGSREVADDLLAEAFARALNAWTASSVPINPGAWLQRVCVNLAHSRWRRARTALTHLARTVPEVVTAAAGPERVVVWQALKTVPRTQREALVMHYIGDFSLAEIAAATGVPMGTVKARLSRGRRALAQHLGETDALLLPRPSRQDAVDG